MAEIDVLSSIATREAYNELVPQFERVSGHQVVTTWAGTVDILKRMTGGETHDLVIVSSREVDELIKLGKFEAGSRVDLAQCGIGVAVRAGAARPDISSSDALKRALIAAESVGYTRGPSGVYMGGLIERMGIAAEIKPKFKSVPSGGTIGTIVANGECEIGFQQISELVHIKGIDYIGPLPAEVQRITVFSTGIPVGARNAAAAKVLVQFLRSPAAIAEMKKHGLDAA